MKIREERMFLKASIESSPSLFSDSLLLYLVVISLPLLQITQHLMGFVDFLDFGPAGRVTRMEVGMEIFD
jgi:hypothetical protein